MNYREAVESIHRYHLKCQGAFIKTLPDPRDLTLEDLLRHGKYMLEITPEIGPFEVIRFSQEFDIIRLMIFLLLWDLHGGGEIGLEENTLETIEQAIHDRVVGGWIEDGEDVGDVLRSTLEKVMKSRQFPVFQQKLLETNLFSLEG